MLPFLPATETVQALAKIVITYLLALAIGWDREREAHSTGLRTFPLVGMASCGYLLVLQTGTPQDLNPASRVVQGLITGIGFVGAGAILRAGDTVRGTATAASIWSMGVIGAAMAMGKWQMALLLTGLNFLTLRVLLPLKKRLDNPDSSSSALL